MIGSLLSSLLCFHAFPSIACSPGSYKDAVGNFNCSACPAKSTSTSWGAVECICELGYYRAMDETAADPCSGKEHCGVFVNEKGKGGMDKDMLVHLFLMFTRTLAAYLKTVPNLEWVYHKLDHS